MRRKRYTAQQAEREVAAFLRDLDRQARALAKLSPEDVPADLAQFGTAAQAFRAHFGAFLERWENNLTRRQILRTASMMRDVLRAADILAAGGPLDPEIAEEAAETRAWLEKMEPLLPALKAALADNTAPPVVKTTELERMLREAPKRKRRR